MGVNSGGDNLLELLSALIENVGQTISIPLPLVWL